MKKNILLLCFSLLGLFIIPGCKNPVKDRPSLSEKIEDPSLINPREAVDLDYYIGRLGWQKPYVVIGMLGDLTGKTVADIGAGAGFFAFKLSEKSQKVIATDIDPEAIQLLEIFKMNLPAEKRAQFETRLVPPDEPMITENEVDAIIIVNTIAYIEDRISYLKKLKNSIKPGGKLLINDFKLKRLPEYTNAPDFTYRIPIHQMENELMQAGFTNFISDDTSLDFQYIIIATNEKED